MVSREEEGKPPPPSPLDSRHLACEGNAKSLFVVQSTAQTEYRVPDLGWGLEKYPNGRAGWIFALSAVPQDHAWLGPV